MTTLHVQVVGCSKGTSEVADVLLPSIEKEIKNPGHISTTTSSSDSQSPPTSLYPVALGTVVVFPMRCFMAMVFSHVNTFRASLIRKIRNTPSHFLAASRAALYSFPNLHTVGRASFYMPILKEILISSYILIRVELITHVCLLTFRSRFENTQRRLSKGMLSAKSRA